MIKQILVIAAIKAPFALLQKPIKVLLFDAVELTQMSLGLVPEILDTVDMVFTSRKQLSMVDAAVMERRNIQCIISTLTGDSI